MSDNAVADTVFGKTKQVVATGDKSKEQDVDLLVADDNQLIIRERGRQGTGVAIPFDAITQLAYERSAHPRAKTAIFISPMFLMSSSKKHWLTIEYAKGDKKDFVLLRLDKGEYQRALATIKAATGKEIERVSDDGR